jgi:hypothetical protein
LDEQFQGAIRFAPQRVSVSQGAPVEVVGYLKALVVVQGE